MFLNNATGEYMDDSDETSPLSLKLYSIAQYDLTTLYFIDQSVATKHPSAAHKRAKVAAPTASRQLGPGNLNTQVRSISLSGLRRLQRDRAKTVAELHVNLQMLNLSQIKLLSYTCLETLL